MGLRSVTPRRLARAVSSRLSRASVLASNIANTDRPLRCNSCGAQTTAFYKFGDRPSGCPYCGSLARERFLLAGIDSGLLPLRQGSRTLHIAPSEVTVANRFVAAGEYVAADLIPRRYKGHEVCALDLTQLADRLDEFGYFDLIYASHVLEHITDDRAAMTAMFAALRPGGQVWIMVPLQGEVTAEMRPGMTMYDLEREFGQWDHVRMYGTDIAERLRSVGFDVLRISTADQAPEMVYEAGLDATDVVFVGRKRNP